MQTQLERKAKIVPGSGLEELHFQSDLLGIRAHFGIVSKGQGGRVIEVQGALYETQKQAKEALKATQHALNAKNTIGVYPINFVEDNEVIEVKWGKMYRNVGNPSLGGFDNNPERLEEIKIWVHGYPINLRNEYGVEGDGKIAFDDVKRVEKLIKKVGGTVTGGVWEKE